MGDFAAFVALHQNYTSQPTSMSDGKGHAFHLPISELTQTNTIQQASSARVNYKGQIDPQQKRLKKNIIKQRAGKGSLYSSKSNMQLT